MQLQEDVSEVSMELTCHHLIMPASIEQQPCQKSVVTQFAIIATLTQKLSLILFVQRSGLIHLT